MQEIYYSLMTCLLLLNEVSAIWRWLVTKTVSVALLCRNMSRHHLSYLRTIFTVPTTPSSKTGGAKNEGIPMLIIFHFDSSKYYPLSVGL